MSCESKPQSFTCDFTQISMIITIQTENEQAELENQSVSDCHENTEIFTCDVGGVANAVTLQDLDELEEHIKLWVEMLK